MSSPACEPTFKVLWPLARKAVKAHTAAQPIPDLSGKTVGELWDYIFRGDVMYPMIREHLRALYPGIKFVDFSVFGNTHGPKEKQVIAELADKLKAHGCDAVISGIGA